jgi:hypothetical protein
MNSTHQVRMNSALTQGTCQMAGSVLCPSHATVSVDTTSLSPSPLPCPCDQMTSGPSGQGDRLTLAKNRGALIETPSDTVLLLHWPIETFPKRHQTLQETKNALSTCP